LADAAPVLGVAVAGTVGVLPAGLRRVLLDDEGFTAALADRSDTDLRVGVVPGNAAYVIYTSGSTGQPKGVLVPHQNVVNHLLARTEVSGWNNEDRFVLKSSLGFDASVWQLLCPLTIGARVLIARHGSENDPAYLVDLVSDNSATILHFVASILPAFLSDKNIRKCRCIRQMQSGGEAVSETLLNRFYEVFPAAEFDHFYGPTETCVAVTRHRCAPSDEGVPPIGRPLLNT
ncbi:AMP-binding protein, partial [Rugosimonospora africana]|uniref:AMP-binding protein n=1 Tax=Rugosimonospora africana TaxID=556532 RepID=UPI0019437A9A